MLDNFMALILVMVSWMTIYLPAHQVVFIKYLQLQDESHTWKALKEKRLEDWE